MAKKHLRFLKKARLHGGKGNFEAGDVAQLDLPEDELEALERGPEPIVEELSAEDIKALEREQKRAAAREAQKEADDEGKTAAKASKGKAGDKGEKSPPAP